MARLEGIYGGSHQEFETLKDTLINVGVKNYTTTLVELGSCMNWLSQGKRSFKGVIRLEILERKRELMTIVDLSLILKLYYL